MYKYLHIKAATILAIGFCSFAVGGCSYLKDLTQKNSGTQSQSNNEFTDSVESTRRSQVNLDDGWQVVTSGNVPANRPAPQITIATALLADDLGTIEPASERLRDSVQLQNIDELGRSNYLSFFDTSTLVDQTIIVFADDSMILDSNGKRRVEQLLSLSTQGDYFRVVGCSHGPTKIENGNEVLAENRAKRVAQELFFLGVPIGNVLPEGCWSTTKAVENHPSRGVVLALYRNFSDNLATTE